MCRSNASSSLPSFFKGMSAPVEIFLFLAKKNLLTNLTLTYIMTKMYVMFLSEANTIKNLPTHPQTQHPIYLVPFDNHKVICAL